MQKLAGVVGLDQVVIFQGEDMHNSINPKMYKMLASVGQQNCLRSRPASFVKLILSTRNFDLGSLYKN